MIYPADTRYLIKTVLEQLEPRMAKPDAITLVHRTGMAESEYFRVRQIGGGPGCGFFQCEVDTARDILRRYLARPSKEALRAKVQRLIGHDPVRLANSPALLPLLLQGNIILGIIVCRIRYWWVPKPIPPAKDIEGQAHYWKDYYNTAAGGGTVEDFIEKAKRLEK